ncbi:MAG TPA: aquaporin [Actinomycetes bacterium]|nr:aquaporin [Actinomycetes bacterium]
MSSLARKILAEGIGTAILVFFAVGSAVFGIDTIGAAGVALTFGLVLLALAYSIGPVSGCHVNPAVTLGVLLRGGISAREAGAYWIAQVVGAIVGALLLKLMTTAGDVVDNTGALGTNDWGIAVNMFGAFVLEVILTFLLVVVVLLVTGRAAAPGFAGLAIGLVLAVVNFVGIPLDGASANPARSLGPALVEGGTPLAHVWLFIVAPLLGGALAAAIAPLLTPEVEAVEGEPALTDPTGATVPPSLDEPGSFEAESFGDERPRYREVEIEERIERYRGDEPR